MAGRAALCVWGVPGGAALCHPRSAVHGGAQPRSSSGLRASTGRGLVPRQGPPCRGVWGCPRLLIYPTAPPCDSQLSS